MVLSCLAIKNIISNGKVTLSDYLANFASSKTCQFSDARTTQLCRNWSAVETRAALSVGWQTARCLYTVDVIKLYQRTRVTCSGSDSVERSGTTRGFCTVWVTWHADATSIGVLGCRALSDTVGTILYVSACITLISSLTHNSQHFSPCHAART